MPERRDELSAKRVERLAEIIKRFMLESLDPRDEGFGGEFHAYLKTIGDVGEARRAARKVGRELGWKIRTYVNDGIFSVHDNRERPHHIFLRRAEEINARVEQERVELASRVVEMRR